MHFSLSLLPLFYSSFCMELSMCSSDLDPIPIIDVSRLLCGSHVLLIITTSWEHLVLFVTITI